MSQQMTIISQNGIINISHWQQQQQPLMDFQSLYQLLAKSYWHWTVNDTLMWLEFIGLSQLKQKFQQNSVDGSVLACLSQEDLTKDLSIGSKIIIKKLMIWIKDGLPRYEELVKKYQVAECNQENHQILGTSIKKNLFPELILKEQNQKVRDVQFTDQPKRKEPNQLIIRNIEQNNNNYCFQQKGATIGRQASNDIVIMDQFVSRNHAEIIYQKDLYFIKDCGSSSGTFIRINQKTELRRGMIIEMGSNQFQINIQPQGKCMLYIIDGPNQEYFKQLVGLETYSVGRKQTNFISFPDDQHLSGIHSKIFKIRGKWYIEDLATTNGTWLRLSRQNQISEQFRLQDGCQFKLSSNLIYECKLNSNNRKTTKKPQQRCLICHKQDRNAIIMPCKHAAGCQQCLNNLDECPICYTTVSKIIKIFTS